MSLLELVSEANIKLGRTPVASISDGQTREAEVYSVLVQPSLDDLVSRANWNFASTTVELVDAEVSPIDPRYQFTFSLPDDLMSIRYAMDAGGSRLIGASYIIEGSSMLTISNSVLLKYVRRLSPDDLDDAPIWFRELFVARIARDACEALTGQSDLKAALTADLQSKFRTAMVKDGQTEPLMRLNDETLLSAAHRGLRVY